MEHFVKEGSSEQSAMVFLEDIEKLSISKGCALIQMLMVPTKRIQTKKEEIRVLHAE